MKRLVLPCVYWAMCLICGYALYVNLVLPNPDRCVLVWYTFCTTVTGVAGLILLDARRAGPTSTANTEAATVHDKQGGEL